jgi:hypothetical protein
MRKKIDHEILAMALQAYQVEAQKIEEKMAAIREQLGIHGGRRAAAPIAADGTRPKRTMSAAGRRRIAAAQKARWKKFHATQSKPSKSTKPKRTISPEQKAALVARLAKARAARAAKKVVA